MNHATPILGGGAESRAARGDQQLAQSMLQEAIRDLRYDPSCARHFLTAAWISGTYDCGCEYESPAISFVELCERLDTDGREIGRSVQELRSPAAAHQRRNLVCELKREVTDLRATLRATRRSRLQWINVARAKRRSLMTSRHRRRMRSRGDQLSLFAEVPR